MTKGQVLEAWRNQHGLTQEGAAALAGSSLSGWRQWERDSTSGPSIDVLRRLEAAHPGLVADLLAAEPKSDDGGATS